jgi:TRAP-type C4-dicarboxylate transport system substrate-binding protein
VQAAELPQALATGVVNAVITSASTGYDSKIWESLTHFYDAQAWIPKNMIIVSKAALDALDKPARDAVLKAAGEAEARGWNLAEEKTTWYLNQLSSRGLKVVPPSAQLSAGLSKIGEQLTADWLKRAGQDGQALVASYRKD